MAFVEAKHGVVAGQLGQVYLVKDVNFLGAPVGADFVALGGQVGDEAADIFALVLGQLAGIGKTARQQLLAANFPHFSIERRFEGRFIELAQQVGRHADFFFHFARGVEHQ